MENQEQQPKSRVVKVESVESWDFYITQATNQACPIVVHFTASWCMPSVAMNPIFEELASSYPDVLFLTVDVDEVKLSKGVLKLCKPRNTYAIGPAAESMMEVATKMEVKAMPTFLLMKDGAPVDKIVGANPEEIRKRIDSFVQSNRAYIA